MTTRGVCYWVFSIAALTQFYGIYSWAADNPQGAARGESAVSLRSDESHTVVEFKRGRPETKINVDVGPFAYGAGGGYGIYVGGALESWNLDKSYIQAIGVHMIKAATTALDISGAIYFETLPRLFLGPRLGMNYSENTGFAALSARILGSDPNGQRFFSILYPQIDLGLRSSGAPYGVLSFGLKFL